MTTNFEWLCNNDRDKMIRILIEGITQDCWGCPFNIGGNCNNLNADCEEIDCEEAIIDWLNAEHVVG